MKIEIHIGPSTRRFVIGVAAPLALLVAFGSSVDAASPTFAAGEPLSAAKINNALGETDARLAKLEARLSANGKLAAASLYCGATLGSTAGDMSGLGGDKGYVAAKKACQTTCDKSPTAHMCTNDEIMRSAALGIAMKNGWFAGGDVYYADCIGFGTTSGSGSSWNLTQTPHPQTSPCATALPVLCCDAP
jgi:hypothetical protein